MTTSAQPTTGGATYRVLRELGSRSQHAYAAIREPHELVVVQRFARTPTLGGGGPREGVVPVTAETLALLLRDARCLAKNWHPNVARVRHVDLNGPELTIATELLDGVTLADLLQDAAAQRTNVRDPVLPLPLLVRVLVDVLGGLHGIHGLRDGMNAPLGAIHGELCPANVVLGRDGVARLVTVFRKRPVEIGASSEALGYAAPEALDPNGTDDPRADLYAIGVILWEALTGRRLWGERDPARVRARQREEELVRPELPEASPFTRLADVAMRALSFDPALRHKSASEMATELRRIAGTRLAPGSAVAQLVTELAGEKIRARRSELDPTSTGARRRAESLVPPPSSPEIGSGDDDGELGGEESTSLGLKLDLTPAALAPQAGVPNSEPKPAAMASPKAGAKPFAPRPAGPAAPKPIAASKAVETPAMPPPAATEEANEEKKPVLALEPTPLVGDVAIGFTPAPPFPLAASLAPPSSSVPEVAITAKPDAPFPLSASLAPPSTPKPHAIPESPFALSASLPPPSTPKPAFVAAESERLVVSDSQLIATDESAPGTLEPSSLDAPVAPSEPDLAASAEPATATPSTVDDEPIAVPRPAPKRLVPIVGGAVAAVVLLAVIGVSMSRGPKETPQPAVATPPQSTAAPQETAAPAPTPTQAATPEPPASVAATAAPEPPAEPAASQSAAAAATTKPPTTTTTTASPPAGGTPRPRPKKKTFEPQGI